MDIAHIECGRQLAIWEHCILIYWESMEFGLSGLVSLFSDFRPAALWNNYFLLKCLVYPQMEDIFRKVRVWCPLLAVLVVRNMLISTDSLSHE